MADTEIQHHFSVRVNGSRHDVSVSSRLTLADLLREVLGLTGTHLGCEHGVCGACTVLVDGDPVRACLMFAVQAAGREITTIEGVSGSAELGSVQQALWDHHGMQCGFCTPGMVISISALLNDVQEPTESDVRDYLSGNMCRCTGYQNIVDAVLALSRSEGEGN